MGGAVADLDTWLERLDRAIPQALAAWLAQESASISSAWILPAERVAKLGKGKFPLSKKLRNKLKPLIDKPFASREEQRQPLPNSWAKTLKRPPGTRCLCGAKAGGHV